MASKDLGLPNSVSKRKRSGSSSTQKKEKCDKNKIVPVDIVPNTVESGKRGLVAGILFIFIGCGLGYIHMYHVSTLFENNWHFSHLSTMEREMTFRTEMGLYYSYYKRLIEAPSYQAGLERLTHDNLTEFPNVINTLQRFNLVPEVVIAFLYRSYVYVMDMFNLQTKECWQIVRGPRLPLVTSCEGLGDPFYFYLQIVWLCTGLTVLLLFVFGTYLSDSILGGILTVMCFFYNHSEATRVQWTPPLRESFAYPFILLHILYITYIIREEHRTWTSIQGNHGPKPGSFIEVFLIFLSTVMCLTLWQFSQFVLATQIAATFVLFTLRLISVGKMSSILHGSILGIVFAAITQSGIIPAVGSLLPCMVLSLLLSIKSLDPLLEKRSLVIRVWGHMAWAICGTFAIRGKLRAIFPNEDDNHIINILKSKLWNYQDFHTLLYTCSAEFDFMQPEILQKLTDTLLLPSAIAVVLAVLVLLVNGILLKSKYEDLGPQASRDDGKLSLKANLFRFVEPHVLYIILQLGAFTIMAGMIMRLKLFFTPHLCVLVSLLASRKYFSCIKSERVHWVIIVVLISAMSYQGVQNIKDQHSVIGEFLNLPFEELLNWVKTDTATTAVFAGPMPIMANLLLSTGRPIVNHPHYENYALRQRTKFVYTVFSRKSAPEVFSILSTMKVDYVVLEESWCFRESKKGCSMTDLWDLEEPENNQNPRLCPQLFTKSPVPFHRAFGNEAFVVLQLHSQVVEFRPRKEYKE